MIFIFLIPITTKCISLNKIKNELVKHNIKHIEIVVAQIRLETGNLKSKYFKKTNNLFGFSLNGKLIKYRSVSESIKDYKRWQTKYYRGGCYYEFLKMIGYAEDRLYIKKLKEF